MSENWDDHADGWDNNQGVNIYANKAFETLQNAVDINGLNILDFGCGTSLLTEKMAAKANHIVALDPSEKMISVLSSKKLPNVTTLVKHLTATLIEENLLLSAKFDLISCFISICLFAVI